MTTHYKRLEFDGVDFCSVDMIYYAPTLREIGAMMFDGAVLNHLQVPIRDHESPIEMEE